MAMLVEASAEDIVSLLQTMSDIPDHHELRVAENGLVMLRARIGGDGAPFNLGEATVTRAAIRLAGGTVGFGYVLGRDKEKARLIALCDALIQTPAHAEVVEAHIVAPIRARVAAARAAAARETAATKVEFFTLVRGEG